MPEPARSSDAGVFPRLARLLGRVEIRLVLSVAIIISLLPFTWVTRLDAVFLVLFSAEFLARALLVFRGEALFADGSQSGVTPTEAELQERRGWEWPRISTLLLLSFDLMALLSFLPSLLGSDIAGAAETRWLRLFRLSRMLLLIGYWAPLVRDVWSVLLRRERAKQVMLMGFIVLALSFAGAVVIDQLQVPSDHVIDFNGDGEVSRADDGFFVHLWWAFRQIQDPGNMLSAPQEVAAVVVSLALTIVGLFMVSFLIGLGTDVVRELLELSRLRPPDLRGHTIVVNIDPSTQQLLHELLRYSRKLFPEGALSLRWLRQLLSNTMRGVNGARYLVVGRSPDPPDFLRQPELARIVYRQGHVDDETFLVRTDVAEAQRVVLFADLHAADPDAETIQALLTITESLREADTARRSVPARARLLIAEILDESNVPAAREAITGAGVGGLPKQIKPTRAFVVPSERLIALFIACVTRRPGVGRLLEELLTSHGHELYTLFFSMEGLGYYRPNRPTLPDSPDDIMAELITRSRSLDSRERVVPVGVLLASDDPEEVEVHINPESKSLVPGDAETGGHGSDGVAPNSDSDAPAIVSEAELVDAGAEAPHEEVAVEDAAPRSKRAAETMGADQSRCLGFVAIAANFGRIRELANDLYDRPRAQVPDDQAGSPHLPSFRCAKTTRLHRVLICGFRSGTVSMVEALIKAEPRAQLLIMVADERAREAAWDDFDAHTKLIQRRLLRGHHGLFHADKSQWALTWIDPEHPERVADHPHIHLVTGDWSSSRRLTALPLGFGRVGSMNAVVLISSEHSGSDARTAKTLMKLETLTRDLNDPPRVVAEVLDVELARRLRRRAVARNDERVQVYSIQELRAFFMFQSVVVPYFDLVYAELMGPWGESFVQLEPVKPGSEAGSEAALTGKVSFEELANHLSASGQVLAAVELYDYPPPPPPPEGDGDAEPPAMPPTILHVASGDERDDDHIDLARLAGVWVIARDAEHTHSHGPGDQSTGG